MSISSYRKRIIIVILLLTFCGLGAKLYLSLAHGFHQMGLAMKLGGAVNKGDSRQVETLLKEGADPNAADLGDSLLVATARDDKSMVRLLLKYRLLKYRANPSRSLLSAENVDQARAMLALGADVNFRIGYDGDTPLMSHATSGNVELVKFLLQNGADATLKCQRDAQRGETILEIVEYAAGNHPEMAAQYQAITKMLKQAIVRQSTRPTQ